MPSRTPELRHVYPRLFQIRRDFDMYILLYDIREAPRPEIWRRDFHVRG